MTKSDTLKALDYSSKPKMGVRLYKKVDTKKELSLAYTPGIAKVSKAIQADDKKLFDYTFVRNNLAVISEGSAVLGLGNIGHKASYPVMEGKAMLFKKFGDIDAIPIIIKTQEVKKFVKIVKNIADSFGAINLEDIAAPRCFEIEKALVDALDIPVMHDDQHGTAIVVSAALINALKLVPKKGKKTKIVIVGAGAAGTAVTKLLVKHGFKNIIVCDSRGVISKKRRDLNWAKKELLKITNPDNLTGLLGKAIKDAGVFIGLSQPEVISEKDIKRMSLKPIIFAMANPTPEIMPEKAIKAGAAIVGTGRSDFKNQINNALAFPGLFRGAMDAKVKITDRLKLQAVKAIVKYQENVLGINNLLPEVLDKKVHRLIAKEVYKEAQK